MSGEFLELLYKTVGKENVLIREPMRLHTTFKIGGPADYFVFPENIKKICSVVELCRKCGINYIILGNGSNMLVSDEGFRGAVIQIKKNADGIITNGSCIYAEAGALLSGISLKAAKSGLTGFEFASGIPGTLGGAVLMNAGAYGSEMKNVIVSVNVYKPGEGIFKITNNELKFGYRTSLIKHTDWIILSALIRLDKGDKESIQNKIENLRAERISKQPVDAFSAGSAFKRPEGYFAGKLIMDAGLKGYSIGEAAVSEKHCGFLINKGKASASDMKKLFNYIIKTVQEKFGVTLEPEVRFIGNFQE